VLTTLQVMSDVDVSAARASDPSGLSREWQGEVLTAWEAGDPAATVEVRAFIAECLDQVGASLAGSSVRPLELAGLDPTDLRCAAGGVVVVRELALRRLEGDDRASTREQRVAASVLDRALHAVIDRLALEREELARRHHDAMRSIEQHERVVALMAHDLRSPLAAIDLGGAVLLELPTTRADPFVQKQAQLIRRNVGRMTRLIADLLDSSTIRAGHLALERQRCALSALLGEAVEAHRALALEKEVALEADVRIGDHVARCDRARVHQALSQLLGTAIELCDAGNEVTLVAEACGAEARVSVIDTGPGIPEPDMPHVFELFGGGPGRRSKGLGLFIARGIIEAHGGRIGVERNERQGSTFWFTLPLTDWNTGDREP
jgi:signal transduction histidine kinase